MRLPKTDRGFTKYAQQGFYQRQMTLAAMAMSGSWRMAVDVGSHVGFTANDLARFFTVVHAFEPQPDNFKCLVHNASHNVIPHNIALGDGEFRAGLRTPLEANSGAWMMWEGDDVQVKTLDSYEFNDVGLIKIDVQGYELAVLKGAEQTIANNRPVIAAEFKVEKQVNKEMVSFLIERGYDPMFEIKNDMVFVPRERKNAANQR